LFILRCALVSSTLLKTANVVKTTLFQWVSFKENEEILLDDLIETEVRHNRIVTI